MPTGTVIDPILFNLYINVIQKRISHEWTLVQNADDCMIFVSRLTSNDALK